MRTAVAIDELAIGEDAVARGNGSAVLERIVDPATHLAIWHRSLPADLDWIDGLDWDSIDDLDFAAAADDLEREVADGLAQAGYAERDAAILRNEIVVLARCFAAIMAADAVRIRLEIVQGDACRKFHADNVTARLLTTLSGIATQWVSIDAPGVIHQLSVGEVALFKGRRWAEQPAILHRSPPISGTGASRLLLAIDPIDLPPENDA